MELPQTLLVEADLFISYLIDDELASTFSRVVEEAARGATALLSSSEVYDDVVSALRSQGVPLEKTASFISDMSAVPHKALPVTVYIAEEALRLYISHGGPRKLHYFDAYHVATAKTHSLPLLTSDRYIIEHATSLGITALDAVALKP